MSTSTTPPGPRKATLFCPGCGHESPVDGDWLCRERAGDVVYECPDCHTPVTGRRPERVTRRC
ncbi:hypothetical protein BRC78_04930 [Halobacteriales archaeon QH_8_68_33]|nr:MAG: hypothetical protein BRC78_04930 [Halobacteriales archaeon QH_8_68_33]